MQEDEYKKRRFTELADKSYRTGTYFFTDFLSMSDISLLVECKKTMPYMYYELWGGRENTERQIARFGNPEEIGYTADYPVSVIHISPLINKFAENLTHRDFLGAIMKLGVKRETVGDILVNNKDAYVFVLDKMASYLKDNLDKVKRTSVKAEIVKNIPENLECKKQEKEIMVASERIDAIIAAKYKLSRSQVIELFRAGKVYLNGRVYENNSYIVKRDDVISVRGHGKIIYKQVSKETRKGKKYITIEEYV